MTKPEHAEREHALLSASGASRWLNCMPSARLTEDIPDKRSEFADEGTAAHEYAEMLLRRRLTVLKAKQRRELDAQIEVFRAENPYYDAEMEDAIRGYVEYVEERFMAAKARSKDAVIILEDKLDYSEWVPEGVGTGDVVIIADKALEIIDLKYGKGVVVDAVGNPQTRLYGLGAYAGHGFLYDIDEVVMTIYQPRLDNISTEAVPIADLLHWAETFVRPRAAMAWEGKGEFVPGDHCRWCKVKATCRARAEENMKVLQYEFQDPALLSIDEIGQILTIADRLAAWANDVKDYAQEQAVRGARFPGWKLVEGRSNRQIVDKDAAKAAFEAAGFDPDQFLKTDLLGIGDLEKRIGKKKLAELLGDLIQKPPGKPVLVPETDRRPEINSIENDFAGEEFDL